MLSEKKKLTKTQIEALRVAARSEGAWSAIGVRSRAGGAYSRMCDRLAEMGLLERRGPHAITTKGREVLAEIDARKEPGDGR